MSARTDRFVACIDYLEEHCNPTASRPYTMTDYRYALVLWTFVECIRARTILEIGIGPDSVSGMTFCHAMEPGGTLWSVDVDPTLPKASHLKTAERLGITWLRAYGDSLSDDVMLPTGLTVDLLYIDGNHDAAHAEGDLEKFLPHLRPGGYLLIDDFPPERGVGHGRPFIDAMLGQCIHLAHEAPHGNGRIVWQRPL